MSHGDPLRFMTYLKESMHYYWYCNFSRTIWIGKIAWRSKMCTCRILPGISLREIQYFNRVEHYKRHSIICAFFLRNWTVSMHWWLTITVDSFVHLIRQDFCLKTRIWHTHTSQINAHTNASWFVNIFHIYLNHFSNTIKFCVLWADM